MENKEIETIQEELKYKIITLDDETEDSKIKKLIDDIIKEINQYIQFCPIKPCEFGIKKESLLPFRRIRKLHLIPS